jgi:hypothetical protein
MAQDEFAEFVDDVVSDGEVFAGLNAGWAGFRCACSLRRLPAIEVRHVA